MQESCRRRTDIPNIENFRDKLYKTVEGIVNPEFILLMEAEERMRWSQKQIVYQTLLFRTIGLFGGCAVQSGELELPTFAGPATVCIRENTKAAENTVNQSVAVMKKE